MRDVAVVDRIVDGERAVLLVGDPPTREVTVAVEELPAGAREGDWLEVELEGDDRLASAAIDRAATERARERARKKREALRRRGRRLT